MSFRKVEEAPRNWKAVYQGRDERDKLPGKPAGAIIKTLLKWSPEGGLGRSLSYRFRPCRDLG